MRLLLLVPTLLGGCVMAVGPTRVVETTYTVQQQATMLAPAAPPASAMPALPLHTASLAGGMSYTPVQGPPGGYGHVVVPPAGTARGGVRLGRYAELGASFELGPGTAAVDTRSGVSLPLQGALWRGGVDYRLPVVETDRGVGLDFLYGIDLRSVDVVQDKTETVVVYRGDAVIDETSRSWTDSGSRVHLGAALGTAVHIPVPQISSRATVGIAAQTMPTYVAEHVQQRTCTVSLSQESCAGQIDPEKPNAGLGLVATPALGLSTALGEGWLLHVQGYGLLGRSAASHPVGLQVLFSQQIRTGG